MVLANKVTASVYIHFLMGIGLLLSAQSCRSTEPAGSTATIPQVGQSPQESPRGEVASYKVQIDVRDGRCVLNYDGPKKGQVETGLSAPCEFSRGHTGGIKHYEYKNRLNGGTYSVMLI